MSRQGKILVTHVKPHLDDICGIWLYRRYVSSWKEARNHFIPTNASGAKPYGGKPVDRDPNIVHIGVCRGKYDEHKGNLGESAATLVFKDLRRHGFAPKGEEAKALQLVLSYVLEGDLGLRAGKPDEIFGISRVIMGIPDSMKRTEIGGELLDALLNLCIDQIRLDHGWRKKKVFRTPWGRGAGVITAVKAVDRAYQEGFVLVVQVDPVAGYRSIRANAHSKVDLNDAYQKTRILEPKADWYLHHSKRMLICGSDVAPQSIRSKLTLDELIDLVRK